MNIAVVSSTQRGETDRLISMVAEQLQTEGVGLAGIVKSLQRGSEFANGCDMDVRVLPDGPVITITQSLGKGSDSCRLDPGAIANAVSTVGGSDLEKADLFILNKFGPEEAAGRGFCAVIGLMLEHGIPVLVGVGSGSLEAFRAFADGMAITLPADHEAIHAWCLSAIASATQSVSQ